VTNRRKETYRGKSLVSYALGTPALMRWLDQNPLVEFQGIQKVYDPAQIGRNPRFIAVVAARAIDLSGRIALQIGKGNVATGPAEVLDFVRGAELSAGGRILFALPSRNRRGQPNIYPSLKGWPNLFAFYESVDKVATEHGIASLRGLSLRERAQALIDIAHPDDRGPLVEKAKARKIIYADQVYLQGSGLLFPTGISRRQTFKGGIEVLFRPIRPSDEEPMRRLFYRFSGEAIYARYFGHVQSMPHAQMQHYVNVDWGQTMSIVGEVEENAGRQIVAEARYIQEGPRPRAEVVFIVDERYQRLGIARYLLLMLKDIAVQRGLQGFDAEVLLTNSAMMRVFKTSGLAVRAQLECGTYHVEMVF
jgi:GNAT superfamily N-acetyltransferase